MRALSVETTAKYGREHALAYTDGSSAGGTGNEGRSCDAAPPNSGVRRSYLMMIDSPNSMKLTRKTIMYNICTGATQYKSSRKSEAHAPPVEPSATRLGDCNTLNYRSVMDSHALVSFRLKTVREALTQHFKDEKTTLKGNSLALVAELLRLFTKEALTRAADQAKNEGDDRVTIDHLEKILPQLLLDM
ncbi:centromere protein x [Plakobranchus ocellatus]|uniref:Centromere protein X n=1 Tax=Plakobranchus ocellatus TaxID=259542 RepID=A0AAV3YFE6_9GAST|nr:centromere protein x [Plakobranchus ocellatus]